MKIIEISMMFIVTGIGFMAGYWSKECDCLPVTETVYEEIIKEANCNQCESANQETIDLREILMDIMDEDKKDSAIRRAEFFKRIKKDSFIFNNRVNETLAQSNQIKSWFKAYHGTKDDLKDSLNKYLKESVYTPQQYDAYQKLKEDKRDSARMIKAAQTLGEVQNLLALTEDQKQAIYESVYLNTTESYPFNLVDENFEKSLSQILSKEDFEKYISLKTY